MGEICKRKDLMVIRGDILEVYFELNGIDPDIVEKVMFQSDSALVYSELPYAELQKGYCLRLESDFTYNLKPSIGTYDLIVEFIDGNKITVAHECGFAILKKRNALYEEG